MAQMTQMQATGRWAQQRRFAAWVRGDPSRVRRHPSVSSASSVVRLLIFSGWGLAWRLPGEPLQKGQGLKPPVPGHKEVVVVVSGHGVEADARGGQCGADGRQEATASSEEWTVRVIRAHAASGVSPCAIAVCTGRIRVTPSASRKQPWALGSSGAAAASGSEKKPKASPCRAGRMLRRRVRRFVSPVMEPPSPRIPNERRQKRRARRPASFVSY